MVADDKDPGRFYCTFKVHKPHEHGKAPPERPIISGSGSITEGIATYVNHHIKEIGKKHESYLKDTPEFLRLIENINQGPNLASNAILVTMDVCGLYTNIIHKEGMDCMRTELNNRVNLEVPTEFILQLLHIILHNNVFEFHETYWKQNIGAAMGSKPIPDYANIFMASFDKKIEGLDRKKAFLLLKRFLDDYFMIFRGSTKKLHALFAEINLLHPTIKLTMNHTTRHNEPKDEQCECAPMLSIPFLDTMCTIKEGKIEIDLYKKDTDRNQYLLPSSCHPKQTIKAIPYSLSLRIVRTCTNTNTRDLRLEELKKSLLDRGYQEQAVDSAIKRAKKIPRKVALKAVTKSKQTQGPVFAHTYDPRLPSISQIQAKHYRSMTAKNTYLAEVFKRPPITAYRRQPNLRNFLIRAKVPTNKENQRVLKGMKKCGKGCASCPYIKETKNIKINKKNWVINSKLDCNSFNIVYAIICQKENCQMTYIGETKRMLKLRLADHCGYVRNSNTDTATGFHFNSPGHSLSDLRIVAIEKSKRKNTLYRKQRETYHINRFNTLHNGINRQN